MLQKKKKQKDTAAVCLHIIYNLLSYRSLSNFRGQNIFAGCHMREN